MRHVHQPVLSVFFLALVVMLMVSERSIAQQDGQAAAAAEVARQRTPQDAAPLTTPTAPATGNDGEEQAPDRKPRATGQRAGERIGVAPRGRANVLGMHLQEQRPGEVNVVEVAPASPAFDAGVKEGDVILSFSGFRGDNYRKWIEGISRLTTDAEDGSRLPVLVLRDGKELDLHIRIPESSVGPIKLPLGPMPQPESGSAQVGVQGAVPPGGPNVAISNSGPFNDFFGGEASPATQNAMAELVRIGPPPAATAVPPGNSPANANARVGMAGFRDSGTGMLVMVDVGALEPGTYSVSLGDPSMVSAAPGQGTLPNPPLPPNANTPSPFVPPPAGDTGNQAIGTPATPNGRPAGNSDPSNNAPAAQPGNASPDTSTQGSLNPATIPSTVLAQVQDPSQAQPGTTIPPTGQTQPSTVPPTGNVNPSDATPTGQSSVNNALLDRARANQHAQANAGGHAPNQIGILTVDNNGAGRMKKLVEGLRVQDVVGQAIILSAEGSSSTNPVPSGPAPGAAPPVPDPTISRPASPQLPPTNESPSAVTPPGTTNQVGHRPVAAGIIRLMGDRRPDVAGDPLPDDVFSPPQPAAKAPAAGPNQVR